jgi:m7GpppX diphosphatase
MIFIKLDTLEICEEYNIYNGIINDIPAVLFSNNITDNNIEIKGNITFRNDNLYNFDQDDIIALYFPVDNVFINKFSNKIKIVTETYDDYKNKIEPYIDSILTVNTQWIKNILYHNYESNNILFNNNKIICIKNIFWKNLNDFYILVIPYQEIKTIRDLNYTHKELLIEMKYNALLISKKYQINEDELYFFFHYHPSCYHLHLHVSVITHKNIKPKLYRHIMFDTVFDNIENMEKKTIKFEINTSNPIYKLLKNIKN